MVMRIRSSCCFLFSFRVLEGEKLLSRSSNIVDEEAEGKGEGEAFDPVRSTVTTILRGAPTVGMLVPCSALFLGS